MYLLRISIAVALVHMSSLKAPAAPTPAPGPNAPQEHTVKFSWDSPRDSSVITYKIYWGTGRRNYQHVREIKRELRPTHRAHLSLAANTQYYVAVSACNMVGESRLSNEIVVPAAGHGSND